MLCIFTNLEHKYQLVYIKPIIILKVNIEFKQIKVKLRKNYEND